MEIEPRIELFSLSGLFSRCRSCDVPLAKDQLSTFCIRRTFSIFKNSLGNIEAPIIKTNCVISLIIFLIFQGNNALHYAVSFRNWKIVDVLLGTGSMNLNLPNKVLFYYEYLLFIVVELAFVCKRQEGVALKQFGDLYRQIIMTRGYKL